MQADVGPAHFEAALDAWITAPPTRELFSAEACWNFTMRTITPTVPPPLRQLLHSQLTTRHQSARLQAFQQMADQSLSADQQAALCCAVFVNGKLTDANDVAAELRGTAHNSATSTPEQAPFKRHATDHVLIPATAEPATHTVVLYGAPGTLCFESAHATLAAAVTAHEGGGAEYIVRLALLHGCADPGGQEVSKLSCLALGTSAPPALAGYGVELVVKDMEYSQARARLSLATSLQSPEKEL